MSPGRIGDDDVAIELEAVQVSLAAGVGRVIAAGERARELIDRRVLVGPIDPCGECEVCRWGGGAICPQARRRDELAATAIAAARWLVPLGDGLDIPCPAAAAVAGDVALAYTLYARAGVAPREPVIVIGESPIARFLIEILVAKGIAPIAIAETAPWVSWLATKGVTAARDRAALGEALTAQSLGTRPWRMICGDPAAVRVAIELARPRSTLTVLASAPVAIGGVLAREVAIVGVAGAHPDLVVEAAAMCVKGEIDLIRGTSENPGDPHRTHVRTSH